MNEKGYALMRDILSPDETDYALSAYVGDTVDYPKMKKFIDTMFLPAVARKLPFMTDPRYVKFRFSDNNNSTDAAVVHRDVYNFTGDKTVEMYTVLCYLDDSEMELHEYSHGAHNLGLVECFKARKRIQLGKGDVLVFYSTLLHRGVKFGQTKHRRLLQVFDVFPTAEAYEKYFPLFCIVKMQTSPKFDWLPILIAQYENFIDAYNVVHYVVTYYSIQYKLTMTDVTPMQKSGRILSYEPSKAMPFADAGRALTNINIICDPEVCNLKGGRFYLYVAVTALVMAYALRKRG